MAKKDNSQLLNSMDENYYSFGSDSDIEADIRELLSYKAKKKPGRPKNPNTNAMMKVLLKVAKDVSTVSENISKVTQQLEVTNSHLEGVISRVETLEVNVESLTREAKVDSDRISTLEQKVDQMEQYGHRLTAVLTWNPITPQGNDDDAVIEQANGAESTEPPNNGQQRNNQPSIAQVQSALKEKLALDDSTMSDIRIRRTSRRNNSKFLLHLGSPAVKNLIFRSMKTHHPDDMFLNEYLTKRRENIFYQLRKMKAEEKKFHQVYTFHGDIFVKYNSNDSPKQISSLADI